MIPQIKKMPKIIALTACFWWVMVVILVYTGQLNSHSKWMGFQVVMASLLAFLCFIWISGEFGLWIYKMTPAGRQSLRQHHYTKIREITTSDDAVHHPDLGHLLDLQYKLQKQIEKHQLKNQKKTI